MPDTPRPQDVDPTKPVVDADQEHPPTPQGRTDSEAPAGEPLADGLDGEEDDAQA